MADETIELWELCSHFRATPHVTRVFSDKEHSDVPCSGGRKHVFQQVDAEHIYNMFEYRGLLKDYPDIDPPEHVWVEVPDE